MKAADLPEGVKGVEVYRKICKLLRTLPEQKRANACVRAMRLAAKQDAGARQCEYCGGAIPVEVRSDRAYCSDSCRVMAYRRRKDAH